MVFIHSFILFIHLFMCLQSSQSVLMELPYRSFLGQIPLLLVAIVLCLAYLPNTLSGAAKTQANMTGREKLKRLDFLGSLTLGLFILTFLLPVEIGGVKIPWTHPLIPSLFAIAASFLGLFVFIEKRWAKEPLLPLELFAKRDTVLCFWIMSCQLAAQMGVCDAPKYKPFSDSTSRSRSLRPNPLPQLSVRKLTPIFYS